MSRTKQAIMMLEDLDDLLSTQWQPTPFGLGMRFGGFFIEILGGVYCLAIPTKHIPEIFERLQDLALRIEDLGLPLAATQGAHNA